MQIFLSVHHLSFNFVLFLCHDKWLWTSFHVVIWGSTFELFSFFWQFNSVCKWSFSQPSADLILTSFEDCLEGEVITWLAAAACSFALSSHASSCTYLTLGWSLCVWTWQSLCCRVKPQKSGHQAGFFFFFFLNCFRNSLVAQWIRNLPANAGDMGLIPGPRRFHMPWSS